MDNVVPVYVVQVYNNDDNHIVVGEEIRTLCGLNEVENAFQVPSDYNPTIPSEFCPTSLMNDNKDFCSECVEEWDNIKGKILREKTINCDNCNHTVSAFSSRSVQHYDVTKNICKNCYNKFHRNENSNINIPYDEADSDYPVITNRKYKPD